MFIMNSWADDDWSADWWWSCELNSSWAVTALRLNTHRKERRLNTLKHLHNNKETARYRPQCLIDRWSVCSEEMTQQSALSNNDGNTTTHWPWNDFSLSELTELSRASIIKIKSSIERLSECGLDSVEESHGVRDAVEGQNTCTVIQVHSNSGGQRTWDGSLDFVVIKVITVCGTS